MANTKNTIVADRYAEALVETAKEGKLTFEKITTDLDLVKDILKQPTDLAEILINPIISADKKKEIVDKVFSNEIDSLIINFLKLLIDKERFSSFNDIYDAYNKSIDNIKNICRIKVTSAVKMSEEAQSRLKKKLEEKTKKNVVLELNINPDIIAGLVIKISDDVIDMSLRHKLEDLSRFITK